MVDKIDVFLLAAGESSRMFPLSQIMEKSLLPVDGKPVIRIIVENLLKCKKIGRITICCLNKFKKQFEHEFRDISLEIMGFEQPCGTATTLYEGIYQDSSISEWVMVHYADCMTDINYNNFISKIHKKSDGFIAVTNTVKHDYSQVILQDGSKLNKVWTFKEKPTLENYTWSGIAIFKYKAFIKLCDSLWSKSVKVSPIASAMTLMLKKKPYYDIAMDVFPEMLKLNSLSAYPYNGYWYDLGNLNSYRKVCEKYSSKSI